MLTKEQTNYLIKNIERMPLRRFLIDTFTPRIPGVDDDVFKIPLREEFILTNDMIINYNGPPVKTTVPIFIVNVIILAVPLRSRVDYINMPFTNAVIDKMQDRIIDLLIESSNNPDIDPELKMDVKMFYHHYDSLAYIGHFSELATSAYSKKSLTTSPAVIARAKELYEKHKHELDDPRVVVAIEDELISMDKDWLKGDVGSVFFESLGAKGYDIHRKSLFITQGAILKFDKQGTETSVVKPPLHDGWDKKDFVSIVNNIRRGSYGRANSTQQGGYLTKIMYRVYSSVKINIEDCGTKKGIKLVLTEPDKYIGRFITKNGKTIPLTSDNVGSYVGKEITVRDPFYCEADPGFCFHCMTDVAKAIGADVIVSQVSGIGSTILQTSMKAMHGVKQKVLTIDYKDYFIDIE